MEYKICSVEQKGKNRNILEKKLISFRGKFVHKLSEQGRLSLPSDFKQALRNRGVNRLVAVRYPDCLRIWPEDEWEKKEQAFEDLNLDDERISGYLRYLYTNLMNIEVDRQGRLVLAEEWRKELDLKEQVCIIGMGNLFELWNPEKHQWKSQELAQQFSSNRDYVVEILGRKKQDEQN